ncbi:MAG TPA: RNA-binding S4 domain-containing protein [Bacteroidales bacterium]|nr:RNA-binding S4 domain-containing protein [Bacteroidales bacterium]
MEGGVRIDKWLWAVRLYKTRSLASEACRSGKVKVLDQAVKPSHEIKTGEVITVSQAPLVKTVRVLDTACNRVGAKLVPERMEDLTPESEYLKLKQMKDSGFGFRNPGTGRPTKRDRREIEFIKRYLGE